MTTHLLVTLSQLARRADVPAARVSRLVQSGKLFPDFRAGTIILFEPERLSELRARLHPAQSDTVQS